MAEPPVYRLLITGSRLFDDYTTVCARPAVRPAGYQVRPPALPGFGDLR